MSCLGCNRNYIIVNKKYGLCQVCNHIRLHPEKSNKDNRDTFTQKKYYPIKRTAIVSTKQTKEKRKELLKLDEATYFIVFSSKPHKCEECGKPLPSSFKDKNGNINAIFQYSHILTKSAFPEFRHNHMNFNRLCFEHHQQWEFGNRSTMNIYASNELIIEKIRSFNK